MKPHVYKTAQLGELVVAAFDEASRYSADPREVSRLATKAVAHMLERKFKRPRDPKVAAIRKRESHQRIYRK